MRRWILFSVAILTGCVRLPGPERFEGTDGGNANPRSMMGDADSDRPVRVGRSRDQLHATLGRPFMHSADNSIESYRFYRRKGFLFCFVPLGHFWGDQTSVDFFDMVLRFNSQDQLSAWEFGEQLVRGVTVPNENRYEMKYGETVMFYTYRKKVSPATRASEDARSAQP